MPLHEPASQLAHTANAGGSGADDDGDDEDATAMHGAPMDEGADTSAQQQEGGNGRQQRHVNLTDDGWIAPPSADAASNAVRPTEHPVPLVSFTSSNSASQDFSPDDPTSSTTATSAATTTTTTAAQSRRVRTLPGRLNKAMDAEIMQNNLSQDDPNADESELKYLPQPRILVPLTQPQHTCAPIDTIVDADGNEVPNVKPFRKAGGITEETQAAATQIVFAKRMETSNDEFDALSREFQQEEQEQEVMRARNEALLNDDDDDGNTRARSSRGSRSSRSSRTTTAAAVSTGGARQQQTRRRTTRRR
ncbi:hypothetical protein PTSG_04248 [Salpingoeca rosetta]|uniref:Uncharacterized protein n=1 Tax=Salpingoeca rosetta (strain ATCC 50818 / BSB-021) TaxID=946362 RepID=F2U709_SALR5|nr:uncharacterized protein PTSG_04248 [Salpingoeca rosetta]EGD83641.1 hypothetical protein PTSG_04248 [Salpingoeca rosetta]|eukprot:XP_004995145.1 hypothetical protein PTSG_04248 [Salpingoeca rosetta]